VFRLAHLSDPHLGPLPRPRLPELAGKRMLGLASRVRPRGWRHDMAVLDAVVEDLLAAAPDHVAVTGDLVNLGLAAEFPPALDFLARLGAAEDVSVVPGNHDCYVPDTADDAARVWADHLRGDDGVADFPYLRRRGPLAIVGVSSAVPTMPVSAAGRVGEAQCARLREMLAGLAEERLFRVVLVHHPPAAGTSGRLRRLLDGPAFRAVLAASGAELVLHGHDHHAEITSIAGPRGAIPVVGAASASIGLSGRKPPAAWNLFEISGRPGAFGCSFVERGLTQDGIRELRRHRLA
jgi:3',5'-cyclic AMP phosphodiesterase CpdA